MTGPRLLFDENLSSRLVKLLAEHFPQSAHVDELGLRGQPDADLWNHARDFGFVLVSKDNDFRQLSFLRGAPPKVVWLRIGNAPTNAVADLLRARKTDLEVFVLDPETSLITITTERDYP
jgi:predicted nuclease of predicted toxin-antitoxin system